MTTALERIPGITESSVNKTSGLRCRQDQFMLRSSQTLIMNAQAIGGTGGAAVSQFPREEFWNGSSFQRSTNTPLTLTAVPQLDFPSTIVAQVIQTVPATGTLQLRVRGYDQFGTFTEEITPVVTLTNVTNNFIYLSRVFLRITEVAFKSTSMDSANCTISIGSRWDWVQTEDASNHHIGGANLGWGVLKWMRKNASGSVVDGTRYNNDPLLPRGLFAAQTLTVTETLAVAATGTLTATGLADGDTILLGGVTYTCKNTPTSAFGDFKRTGTLATDLVTFQKAVNGTGTPGVDYSAATTAHPYVTVSAVTATTATITARTAGSAGNSITTTETSATASFGGATLSGGVDYTGIANAETVTIDGKVYTWKTTLTASDGDVQIGATVAISLQNLQAAINLGPGAGTAYGASTVIHPTVRAYDATTATTITVKAREMGASGNRIVLAETMAKGAWGASVLAAGEDQSREITGITLINVTDLALATAVAVLGGPQFVVGSYAAGWAATPEKVSLVTQQAGWTTAKFVMVSMNTRCEDI